MPDVWYIGVIAVFGGIAALAFSGPYATAIIATNRRYWLHRPYRSEPVVVRTMIVSVALVSIGFGVNLLLGFPIPSGPFMIVAFVGTGVAAVVAYFRGR